MGHARLSPSGADRWCACPASVRMSEGIHSESSVYADEGTAAHEVLERCLVEGNRAESYIGLKITVPDEVKGTSREFVVDREMAEAVNVALDQVDKVRQAYPNAELIPERQVDPGFLMNRKDIHGTCDISIVLPEKLYTYDYKHGRGHVVEAAGNYQTLLYSIGALAALPPEKRKLIKEIETGIIQPRASHEDGPVRTVVYPIEVVYKWMMYFAGCAAATDDLDAPMVAGEDQCRWCPAKATPCPALEAKTLEVFDAVALPEVEQQVLKDPSDLSIEKQNLIDDMGNLIISFIEAVRGYKLDQMKAGVDYPGYKLVRGKPGNRRFIDPDVDKMAKYLNSTFGLKKDDVTAAPKLLGPAKIVAMAKKSPKVSDKKLKFLEDRIERPEGKIMIAPESDSRPAVMNNIEQTFKDVPKLENENGES